jgi:hypothetical protein
MISFTAECTLLTQVNAKNTAQVFEAQAAVQVQVLLDGNAVPVDPNSSSSPNGPVTFCNRAFGVSFSLSTNNPSTDFIQAFIDTADANAFNWAALNVGNGRHTMQVQAQVTSGLSSNCTAGCAATGGMGQWNLIVEPTHMAPTASF